MLPGPMLPSGWFENDQARDYVSRNPNSILARMFGSRVPGAPDTTGSNNAGIVLGAAQPSTPVTFNGGQGFGSNNAGNPFSQTPDVRPRQGGQRRSAGGGNSPYGGYHYSGGFGTSSGAGSPYPDYGNSAPPESGPAPTPYVVPTKPKPTSFYDGGMMSEQGAAIRPDAVMQPEAPGGVPIGADAPPPLELGQIDAEASKMLQANPQLIQHVQETVSYAIQSGQLTPEEMNMAVQLAKTALSNPASYPQIRQFAIQNGLGTEADLPQEIDKGMLFALISVGKAMQSGAPTGQAQQSAGSPAPAQQAGIIPEYKEGGMTGDKPHIAKVHAREYIVPEKALLYHGKKTFDRLVEQANEVPDDGQ